MTEPERPWASGGMVQADWSDGRRARTHQRILETQRRRKQAARRGQQALAICMFGGLCFGIGMVTRSGDDGSSDEVVENVLSDTLADTLVTSRGTGGADEATAKPESLSNPTPEPTPAVKTPTVTPMSPRTRYVVRRSPLRSRSRSISGATVQTPETVEYRLRGAAFTSIATAPLRKPSRSVPQAFGSTPGDNIQRPGDGPVVDFR